MRTKYEIVLFFILTVNLLSQTLLKTGEVIDTTLTATDNHEYAVELSEKMFVYGVATQLGIDIVVKVFDPNDTMIAEIDAPTGTSGPEQISFITKVKGNYKLVINAFDQKVTKGRYTLSLLRIEDEAESPIGKIDQIMTVWDNIDSPGAAILVAHNGKIVFNKGYGMANLEYEISISGETVFHMASVSKQFTAYAIANLAQKGKLSLDDDIRKYFPELYDFGKTITIRHLVHHTSGLRDQWNLLALAGWRLDDVITKDQIMKLLQNQRELNFEPGAEFLYCNSGYTLMAEIVERVSGKKFAEWTRLNIFEPLKMKNTLFYDDHEMIVKNRAYSYQISPTGSLKKSVLSYANVGATSLFTTAEDLSKWADSFTGYTIEDDQLFELMETRGVLNSGDTITYAFGQGIGNYKGLKLISHGGADAGYRTFLARFPEQGYSFIVLSNLSSFNPGNIAFRIADIFLSDFLQEEDDIIEDKNDVKDNKEEFIVDAEILKDYEGSYRLQPGVMIKILIEENKLMAQATNQPQVQLFPKAEDKFFLKIVEALVTFRRNESGEVDTLVLNQNGEILRCPRIKQFIPDDVDLDQYIGQFSSEELSTSYTFTVKNDQLTAVHMRHPDITLTPTEVDAFSGDTWFFGQVKFERNENNEIKACRISSGRVRNLLFVKN